MAITDFKILQSTKLKDRLHYSQAYDVMSDVATAEKAYEIFISAE